MGKFDSYRQCNASLTEWLKVELMLECICGGMTPIQKHPEVRILYYAQMKNVIILDLDGVLITTPSWKRDDIQEDGYSVFNSNAIEHLNKLLSVAEAELWLISDRRKGFTLEQFNVFFKNRNIKQELSGMVPVYFEYILRIEEFKTFINDEAIKNYLLIDDDSSLDALDDKSFWVKPSSLIGFNEEKFNEAIQKIKHWK